LSRFVAAGGLTWHVQRTGQGPAMLLIHGTGSSTHTWRDLLPTLARRFEVLAVDLPGHGSSAALPPGRASIEGMAQALAELLAMLAFSPQYAVGHSAGVVILCRLALDQRIDPRVIISLNGALLPLAGTAAVIFSPIARALGALPLLPQLIARTAGTRAGVARLIEGTGSKLDADGLELYARLVRNPRHVAGALAMMAHWDLYRFERELPRLNTPLVLIVGEADLSVSPAQARRVRERLPSAEIHRLEGLGHLAHEESPAPVAALIERICLAH
jgi:magnesium chelatase accessory protein